MANEPSQYPFPVSPGGMREGQGAELRALREYLSQDSPRTNGVRDNSMQGAVIGTPGTLPNNWSITGGGLGSLTQQIVALGTINGMDYIDIRFFGITNNTGFNLQFEATSIIAAAQNQAWTVSIFAQLVGGSPANITFTNLYISERNAGGGSIAPFGGPITINSVSLSRYSQTAILPDATAAFVIPLLAFSYSNGVTIDATIRLAWPQIEQGAGPTSPIRTTAAAVTRTIGAVRQPGLGQAPQVVSIAGFGGAGAGAGIINNGSDADQSQGCVIINVGLAPGSSGTVVLRFPVAPVAGQYVVTGEWLASAVLSVAGNNLTVTWTANRPLIPNEDLLLAYQWMTST